MLTRILLSGIIVCLWSMSVSCDHRRSNLHHVIHHMIHQLRKNPGGCHTPRPHKPVPSDFKTRMSKPGEIYNWLDVYSDLKTNITYRDKIRKLRKEVRTEKHLAAYRLKHRHHDGQHANSTVNKSNYRETCPLKVRFLELKELIFYKNEWCWLLKPWRHTKLRYVECVHKSCKGVNSGFGSLYFCQPIEFKYTYYVIICKTLPGRKTIVRRIKLPQRCSCFKWMCPLYSKSYHYQRVG